jgi:hypothetical protein
VATLLKSKRNEVAGINLVQAQVEEKYFIFNLEYRNVALSRGISHGLPTKYQCSTYPKNPSEMIKTQWPHTLQPSLNPEKPYVLVFKPEGPVCPLRAIFQIPGGSVPKPDVSVSTS